MEAQIDARLTYYIAVGSNYGWGRSDKSEAEAIRRMNRNGLQGEKAKKYAVYRCTPNTTVGGLGGLTRPAGDPAPVKVSQVGYRSLHRHPSPSCRLASRSAGT